MRIFDSISQEAHVPLLGKQTKIVALGNVRTSVSLGQTRFEVCINRAIPHHSPPLSPNDHRQYKYPSSHPNILSSPFPAPALLSQPHTPAKPRRFHHAPPKHCPTALHGGCSCSRPIHRHRPSHRSSRGVLSSSRGPTSSIRGPAARKHLWYVQPKGLSFPP